MLKKSRVLSVLIALTLFAIVLVNQTWISAKTIETAATIELSGTEVSALLSPLLVVALLIFLFGFYFNGRVSTFLFATVGLLIGVTSFSLLENLDTPIQTIIDSRELEKAIGQTGTPDEIAPLLSSLVESPAYLGAILSLFALAAAAILASLAAWNWQQNNRSSKSERNTSIVTNSGVSENEHSASSFDLWDEQR